VSLAFWRLFLASGFAACTDHAALFLTGITGQETCMLEGRVKFLVDFDQSSGHTVDDCVDLALGPRTFNFDSDLKSVHGLGDLEGFEVKLVGMRKPEVGLDRFVVDHDLLFVRGGVGVEADTGNSAFTAADSVEVGGFRIDFGFGFGWHMVLVN